MSNSAADVIIGCLTNGDQITSFVGEHPKAKLTADVVDAVGDVCVAGTTRGGLVTSVEGERDAFLTKVQADGEGIWIHQSGTGGDETVRDAALATDGAILIVGTTSPAYVRGTF